jgi:hypothetical protein
MKRLYALHRWLAALAFAQLALWTATGLFFALAPIDRVRGEDVVQPVHERVDWLRVVLPPPVEGATALTLRLVDGRPAWIVRGRDVAAGFDAASGAALTVDADAAARIARSDQKGQPRARSVERIEEAPIEYRGKPVPAWRIELDDGRGTRIYVDARTGEITARRNALWRVFDFMWSLHIMDYGARESFNHPLLVGFAALGLLTVLSGALVWGARIAKRRRATRA